MSGDKIRHIPMQTLRRSALRLPSNAEKFSQIQSESKPEMNCMSKGYTSTTLAAGISSLHTSLWARPNYSDRRRESAKPPGFADRTSTPPPRLSLLCSLRAPLGWKLVSCEALVKPATLSRENPVSSASPAGRLQRQGVFELLILNKSHRYILARRSV